METKNYE